MEQNEFADRRNRRLFNQSIPEILAYALETFGKKVVDTAWAEFHLDEPEDDFHADSPISESFLPWFYFNWEYEDVLPGVGGLVKITLAESFIRDAQPAQDLKIWLREVNRQPFSLLETIEVKRGVGLTFFDLLRQVQYDVVDPLASEQLEVGEIVYAAISVQSGLTSVLGLGPFYLEAEVKPSVEVFRRKLLEEAQVAEITTEQLSGFDAAVREFFFHSVDDEAPSPDEYNIEGHPLLYQTVHFEIESADGAFRALKDLAEGVSDEELLESATTTDGAVEEINFFWSGGTEQTRSWLGEPALLGSVNIGGRELRITVSSTELAEQSRALVEERLGSKAKFLEIEILDDLEDLWPEDDDFDTDPDDLSLEEREAFEERCRQNWVDWFNRPMPLLNEMTPREARETEDGRILLRELMVFYESGMLDRLPKHLHPDVPWLRGELGLD